MLLTWPHQAAPACQPQTGQSAWCSCTKAVAERQGKQKKAAADMDTHGMRFAIDCCITVGWLRSMLAALATAMRVASQAAALVARTLHAVKSPSKPQPQSDMIVEGQLPRCPGRPTTTPSPTLTMSMACTWSAHHPRRQPQHGSGNSSSSSSKSVKAASVHRV